MPDRPGFPHLPCPPEQYGFTAARPRPQEQFVVDISVYIGIWHFSRPEIRCFCKKYKPDNYNITYLSKKCKAKINIFCKKYGAEMCSFSEKYRAVIDIINKKYKPEIGSFSKKYKAEYVE